MLGYKRKRGYALNKKISIDELAHYISPTGTLSDIQTIQTQHRFRLTEFWGISAGENILEIGCGQGDTTAVLAYLTGKTGKVHAVDIASPDYGAPETLGEAITKLQSSPIGKQITVSFETDILAPEVDFPENTFDTIVLSHSSWYVESQETLLEMFTKLHKWGKRLVFAEWDTRVTESHQLPHFLAALLQAQCESFRPSEANIRTLITPENSLMLAEKAGWNISDQTVVPSKQLQDGGWEVAMTISDAPDIINSLQTVPENFKTLLTAELNTLKNYSQQGSIQSMDTFAFIAVK